MGTEFLKFHRGEGRMAEGESLTERRYANGGARSSYDGDNNSDSP